MLGGGAALIVDTRSTLVQAREILDDLRELGSPRGRHRRQHPRPRRPQLRQRGFRPAVIWGHERCVTMIRTTGEAQRASAAEACPGHRGRPRGGRARPARSHVHRTRRCWTSTGARSELTYLGRGHTDNDIVVTIPDADVLCAGDLVENGAPPWFGDGFPMDWPATAEATARARGRADGRRPRSRRPRRPRVRRALARGDPRHRGPRADRPARRDRRSTTRVAAAPYPRRGRPRAARAGAWRQLRGELDLSARRSDLARDAARPSGPGPRRRRSRPAPARACRGRPRRSRRRSRAAAGRWRAGARARGAARSACWRSPSRAARRRAG